MFGEYEPWDPKSVFRHSAAGKKASKRQGEGTRREQRNANTYNHLLHLILDAHARHNLHILHAAENLMLDPKACFHAERSALLDRERLLVERLQGVFGGQVNDDVGPSLDFET